MREKINGVGVYNAYARRLGADGTIFPTTGAANLLAFDRITGVKEVSRTRAARDRFTNTGGNRVEASMTLASEDTSTFRIQTDKEDMSVQTLIYGHKVVDLGNGLLAQAEDTGNPPAQLCLWVYQDAINHDERYIAEYSTQKGTRGWLVPSVELDKTEDAAMTRAFNTVTYEGVYNPVLNAPWAEALDDEDWGTESAGILKLFSNLHLIPNVGRGNGTLTTFNLTTSPATSADLWVFVNGAKVTPTTVTTGATPSFTLGSAPASTAGILAFIGRKRAEG